MAISTKMSAVILNSKTQALPKLKHLLDECGDINLIGTTPYLSVGLKMVQKFRPDFFFLDDKTITEDGRTSIEELSKHNPNIYFVLTCSCENKAETVQKHGLPEYLATPFNRDKLHQIIERKKMEISIVHLKNQMAMFAQDSSQKKVILITKTGYRFVNPDKIVCCRADGNYTEITLLKKNPILITKSLCHFYEESLPFPQFIRISSSVVINKQYLVELIKSERKCVLETGTQSYSFTVSLEYFKMLKRNNFSRFASKNQSPNSLTNMLSLINKSN